MSKMTNVLLPAPLLSQRFGIVMLCLAGQSFHPIFNDRPRPSRAWSRWRRSASGASAPTAPTDEEFSAEFLTAARKVFHGNQPVRRVHRRFFTKSFLGDDAAVAGSVER